MLREQRTYTISEAAKELNVTPSWLRFAERLGSVPRARRAPNRWRYYTLKDLEHLRRLGVGEHKRRLAENGE